MFWSFHPVVDKTNDEHLSKPFCTKIALKELNNLTIKSMSRRPIQTSNFSYTELSPYVSSMVDSYVELNQSGSIHFTMYNGVQCLSMKINYSNLWIRFRRLKRRRTTFEIPMCIYRTKFMDRPKLNISDFVGSNIDLFMYLTEGIRFSTWKITRLNWA